jgi:hypothetical protein
MTKQNATALARRIRILYPTLAARVEEMAGDFHVSVEINGQRLIVATDEDARQIYETWG